MAEVHAHEDCCGQGHGHYHGSGEFNLGVALTPIAIATVLFLIGLIFNESLRNTPFSVAEYAVLIPAYLISGWSVLSTAGRNILKGRIFDENFLMAIATLGAIAIQELPEAVAVMLFFQVGELFQDYSVGRSRRSITALLEVRPDKANLKVGSDIREVSSESVSTGDIIVVRPGEKVPLDGEVIAGKSQIDTSALTGESVPRSIAVGETVLSGTINQSGLLTVRVAKLFNESSISRILELVEGASSKKANTEKFITRFARHYTPVVVFISLAIAVLPPLFIPGATHDEWVYRALVLLVISCPCGLVISIPLGYFGGIGGSAKRGILVKGATFLDTLTQVNTVVFDKTGTLTKGNFRVSEIVPENGFDRTTLLALAAQIESQSNHPVALSILEAYGKPIDASAVKDYEEIAGYGIRARVDGRIVLIGNDRLLHQKNIPHDVCNVDGTVAHIAADGQYAGRIMIADEIKSDAISAIQLLQAEGVRTAMLTGDSQSVADSVAKKLGLDQYRAELLPEEKLEALEAFLAQAATRKKKVVFVGDGINDSPVIARADVGMAMGGLGSDAAIETADVVIMTDAPSKVAEAIQLAKRTLRIVWQNIILAMGVKAVFVTLGAFGLASLWGAVFADVGVALLAILNAGRILSVKSVQPAE